MGSEGESKLSVRKAGKTHGSVVALQDASFDLYEGEFLTLLGPSGSGKTTLLMIVAGLTEPTAGEVWIDGKLTTYQPPHKRDIGMVFQNYALFPHLTVRENIAFPLRMRGMAGKDVDTRVTEALEVVQLSHTADRLPRSLSGGQQQRIALARCFVYRPSIILMDEPLGALDRKLRDQMQLEIKRLHRDLGITVLYVTHDQDEAMTMSDRVCLMNAGRIEQIGTPEELYFQPKTVFTADFVGDSNLVDVTVDREAGAGHVSVLGPGGVRLLAVSSAFAPGAGPARLLLRPESLKITEGADITGNSVEGVVTQTVFLGSVCKFSVELPGGLTLWVKRLSHESGPPPEQGQNVRLTWAPEHGVLLPQAPRT